MNKRYERGPDKANDPDKIVHTEPEQIVTGIPATEEVPPGSPQFDAFKEHERKGSELSRMGQTYEPIENRDRRGADELDGHGKTKQRIPIHEVDEMANEMAADYASDIERTQARAEGDTLTVSITTKHGTASASEKVDDWSKAGVKKALTSIRKKIDGEESSDDPKDKLAEAVREVAKKG